MSLPLWHLSSDHLFQVLGAKAVAFLFLACDGFKAGL